MSRSSNPFHRSARSDDELSSLGELNGFNFGPTTTTDAPPDLHDVHDESCCDVETCEHAYPSPDPHEIYGLVNDATSHTSRLITFFIETSAMLHTPEVAKNANVCAAVHNCLKTIPGTTATPTEYMPPRESSWRTKRRALEVSLLKNLRKYIRFSDHLLRKPPRTETFQGELLKLHAFADKFFYLSMKFAASNEKIRLMELCETYERMKLAHLEERQLRASIRADRAARKAERELLRQQRREPRQPESLPDPVRHFHPSKPSPTSPEVTARPRGPPSVP
ncbi:hypothetical protein B0H16DRAFT_1693193 [Mycena metata]|uniref:Uncharacterized protein n=1 Tax=Mycena metata TaxID=1033252 RepID=A0AAD7N417_9AGAR|nr:hypothetical protein B0H16DRAFT_1693193 [Mycena metata]